MVVAVVISVLIMMLAAEPISAFVHRHPTVKMLALSFLLLIGMSLVAEGFDHHVPRGLHLLRDGILGVRGSHKPPGPEEGRAGAPAGTLMSPSLKRPGPGRRLSREIRFVETLRRHLNA